VSAFAPSPMDGVFRQGEILSDVVQVHLSADSLTPNALEISIEEKVHPYALVLTQDCDLDWDFKARNVQPDEQNRDRADAEENRRQAKLVPNILLCELTTADVLRPRLAGGDVLRRIKANQDERYHYLPAIPPANDRGGDGLPELVADFKRVFSIPTDEVYLRAALGLRRRALMQSPFLQHLSSRFGYFCSRVALPEEVPPPARPAAPVALPPPAPEAIE
jgi:hypothetical protein